MTYNSSFQDRAAQAAEARQKALDQYRAKPPVDEKVAAQRRAAGQERDAARAEKSATKKADRKEAAEAKQRRMRQQQAPLLPPRLSEGAATPAMRRGRLADECRQTKSGLARGRTRPLRFRTRMRR